MKTKVLNAKGEEVILNERDSRVAQYNQKIVNDLGFNIDITALTTIMASVVEQKFFEIAPADYIPVRVGEGSWSEVLTTYRSFETGGDFEAGLVNTGSDNARLASATAGIDSVNIKVRDWAKQVTWSLMELEKASKAGNWDIVMAKQKARKKNWDLGIQRVAFLGLKGAGSAGTRGLLEQVGITTNTTRITKFIKDMTPTELKAFVAGILGDYRENCQYTAWPTHFVIPEKDYLGLAAQSSPDFPVKSTLALLEESFKLITKNDSFKILPLAYANKQQNKLDGVATGKNRYALYNYNEDSIRMDIPVDYTATAANSVNSFQFQNVGYGQFTGLLAYRPKEMLYFDHQV